MSDVAALQENEDALTARVKAATETDLLTIDEARAELGFDPLPDGAGSVTLTAFLAAMAPAPVAKAPVRVSTDVDNETRTAVEAVSTDVDNGSPFRPAPAPITGPHFRSAGWHR